MTKHEILAQLARKGINVTDRTLLNYEHAGLVPAAKRGGGGRAKGRWTEYPNGTVEIFERVYGLAKQGLTRRQIDYYLSQTPEVKSFLDKLIFCR